MHQEVQQSEEPDPTEDKAAESDCIYNYHNARLQCGLLFLNIIDAIKEGDGCRLIQCHKVVLLFDYKFKRTKYAYILLLLQKFLPFCLREKQNYWCTTAS